jgi:hypothetical protein
MSRAGAITAALLLAAAASVALASPPAGRAYHDIEVRLDPDTRRLSAVDRIRLEGTGATLFGLDPAFTLESVAVDGVERAVADDRGQWRLTLDDRPVHTLTVRYRGTLAAMADTGPTGSPVRPVASPDGSFLPSRTGWYPRLDAAVSGYRITIDVPEDQRALAPGRLLAERVAGGRYRATFAFDHAAEGIVLVAGPYRVGERFHGNVRIRTYFHPSLAELEDNYLSKAAEYLELYEGWIGTYPYEAFHVVSSPLPVGFGFPYFTYVGARVLRLPFIPFTSLPHEVLHSWWGNGVEVDYQRGNWAEGLTTFMADYALAARQGAAKAKEMRARWLRDYAALPASRDRPLTAFVARTHGAAQVVGYHKAAMLFHMLREDLGRAAFDAGVRRFWLAHRFRVAGWEDLQDAFERASGRDLDGFFAQWLERTGAPSLKLDGVTIEPANGGFAIAVSLHQDAPAYDLSVPIVVSTAAGQARHSVRLDTSAGRFVIDSRDRPLAVAVDPHFDLFRRLARAEMAPILREVMLAPEVALVVATADAAAREAAHALAERLVEGRLVPLDAVPRRPLGLPLVIIGTSAEIAPALAEAELRPVAERIRGRGTARAWAARGKGDRPVVVVAADGAAALRRVIRPLPHYGAKSFIVFEAARAVEHGLWPIEESPLRAAFE